MTKRKNEICPENVGKLFYNPANKDYYEMVSCETEPSATFKPLLSNNEILCQPVSWFEDFVLMKPTRPIEEVKKPRADKGGQHQRRKKAESAGALLRTDLPVEERYSDIGKEMLIKYIEETK